MHTLLDLYRTGDDLPLRMLVSTRQQPPPDPTLVRAFAVSAGSHQAVVELVHDRLAAARGIASPELPEQTARVIADFADGQFLAADLIARQVVAGFLPSDPAALAQSLRDVRSQPPPGVMLRAPMGRWLDSLGDRKLDALVLLTALARGPAQGMTAEEWLAAAARLGNRPYSKSDLDPLADVVVGRPGAGGTYWLHDLVRAYVLDQDHGTRVPPPQGVQE